MHKCTSVNWDTPKSKLHSYICGVYQGYWTTRLVIYSGRHSHTPPPPPPPWLVIAMAMIYGGWQSVWSTEACGNPWWGHRSVLTQRPDNNTFLLHIWSLSVWLCLICYMSSFYFLPYMFAELNLFWDTQHTFALSNSFILSYGISSENPRGNNADLSHTVISMVVDSLVTQITSEYDNTRA